MKACAVYGVREDGKIASCREPVAYRCVRSWSPLVDCHVCAAHRPPDLHLYRTVYYVGGGDVSGSVVPIEALRERRAARTGK